MLSDELAKHQKAIVDRWVGHVIGDYPEKTGEFLRRDSNPFSNPVGARLHDGLGELADGIQERTNLDELESALDQIIRVRAVQEFSPADSIGFVFEFKKIVREVLGAETNIDAEELADLDRFVDRLGLCAFDVYMRCREQMWMIRAKEIRTQTLGILERIEEKRERRLNIQGDAPHS